MAADKARRIAPIAESLAGLMLSLQAEADLDASASPIQYVQPLPVALTHSVYFNQPGSLVSSDYLIPLIGGSPRFLQ
jgi:hypothetical protein